MESRIVEISADSWENDAALDAWVALEAGKVLYLPHLSFYVTVDELKLFRPDILAPKVRNVSLDAKGGLKGAAGDEATQAELRAMMLRFRSQAETVVRHLFPRYRPALRMDPCSFRPQVVETRQQSWRADDRRMHVDSFPSRPIRGERLLRVFTNVNPAGVPRIWRVGEPFEEMARKFLPRATPYSPWQAKALKALHITKSLRSEYDHLMLQLHDCMKLDMEYQRTSPQVTMPFPAGSVWVCFSDQTTHAAMAGQHMMEQTMNLPVRCQYDPASSPLGILTRIVGHELV